MPKAARQEEEISGKSEPPKLTDFHLCGKEQDVHANTTQMATADGEKQAKYWPCSPPCKLTSL